MTLQRLLRTGGELLVRELHIDRTARDIDNDDIAIFDLTDVTTGCCLRRDVTDTQATRTTREAAISDKGTLLTEVTALDIRSRIKHLLHAWASLRTFVGDDDTVATVHLATEDAFTRIFLRVEDHSRTFEVPQFWSDTGSLHYATVLCDVAEEHSQATIFRVGMLEVADTSVLAVGVETLPLLILGTHLRGEPTARSTVIDT